MQRRGGGFGVAVLSALLVRREIPPRNRRPSDEPFSPVFRQDLAGAYFARVKTNGSTASATLERGEAILLSDLPERAFVAAIDDVFFAALAISLVSTIPFLLLRSGLPAPGSSSSA